MLGGTLNLEGNSNRIANLVDGNLSGPGSLQITNSFHWGGAGTITGSGELVLDQGTQNEINGGNSVQTLSERHVINYGTLSQPGLSLVHEANGAVIENLGTYQADAYPYCRCSSNIIERTGSGSAPRFINRGLFVRTLNAETGRGTIKVPFENDGAVKAEKGELAFPEPITVEKSSATTHHACSGDPVDCGTGNLTETQTDLAIGGRGVGLDLIRTYSAQAAAAGSLGIFGYGWTNSFGDHLSSEEGGNRITLAQTGGGTVPFTQSGTDWLAASWSQDALIGSAEAGFTLTLPDQTKEEFSGSGRLESVTDRNGNATILAYNLSGQLETITDPTGRKITLTYNAEGLVEKAEDPMGHVVKYTYEGKTLKSVTLPDEASPNWQFKYDASHRMTTMTDGRGGKSTNEYDVSNRVISQTDPAQRTTTWKYEGFHTRITNKATGAVTDEWFNSNNQPMSITHGFGTAAATTESFTYIAAGLLASKTDGNGHTTTYGYDAEGNRTSERDLEGDETKWTYNGAHEILTETEPSGEETTIVRDANGNPETISRPAPGEETQTVSYGYGAHGELDKTTDPLGNATTYEYDAHGDRTGETDPEGDRRTWSYDEDSRVVSTVGPRGNEEGAEASEFTTTIERDAQGRPLKVTDPLGGATEYAYDADGNVESITDPNGHKSKFTYDADNEQTKIERPSGAVEETAYDGAGQVIGQTDGDEGRTTYVRNVLEEPVETIDPLERKTTRLFDAGGNLQSKTDPEGRVMTYGYDKANRLTEVSYSSEPGQDMSLSYDENGNPTNMVDATGESTWEYDQLGRLVHAKDGHGETVSWDYNLGDEPIGLTYPNGKSISRAYDKAGRLENVTDWLGNTTSFAYNRDSEPTATTFPVGTGDVDEYSYDRADRLSAVSMRNGAESLASLAYARDPAGQVESLVSGGLPGAEEESFSYDENERLAKAGAAEFGYDPANNITNAPGTINAYDKASQIESATSATFSFDEEGERTKETPSSGPATTYKYDQAGSLTAVERPEEGEAPAIAEAFSYDGTGLLASRTVGLTTTHFVWEPTESPELLLADGEESYIYGPGALPVEQISTEEVPTYLHHDQLGSTRLLTNPSGEVSGTFTYGPYGSLTGKTGTATTVLGYAGQYTLGQTGLVYLRARYYDPATAQFLTVDPAVEATREPFAYARDNPLRFKDPTGLDFAEDIEGIGIPCPVCGAAHGVQEFLEPGYEDLVHGADWVLRNSLGAEELDEGQGVSEGDSSAEEVPCAEDSKAEIGDRGQQMTNDRQFAEKLGHALGSSPEWPTGGSRLVRVAAIIARLIHLYNR